ncbi:MAG: phenylalanine--tRNA ligase subunit alpha, partial [bacterium]|nr:phenylalanine--tRNA ligase subunit alpha [bacterium]
MNIVRELEQLLHSTISEIAASATTANLQQIRVNCLGKKGQLTAVLRTMGALSAEERPRIGQVANEVKEKMELALLSKQQELEALELHSRLLKESIDVTLPGRQISGGHQHPLTKIVDEITDIFLGLGFSVAEGPEVETEYYNFEALNVPPDHPARDMQDSFFVGSNLVLRTQTSP